MVISYLLLREISQLTVKKLICASFTKAGQCCGNLMRFGFVFFLRKRDSIQFPNSEAVTRKKNITYPGKFTTEKPITKVSQNRSKVKQTSLWKTRQQRQEDLKTQNILRIVQQALVDTEVAFPCPQLKAQVKHCHYLGLILTL